MLVNDLDHAIEAGDNRKMQTFESELITKANKDLQLLAPHEYIAFERLQRDRHLCAHPAFVVRDELYQPTPELVRSHIVHALQYLLVRAPLQGKSAIARFDTDLLGSSFPATAEDIGSFIRTRYLDRAKDVLVINLLKAIVSAPFGAENAKYASKIRTLALTLREIANAKTQIYDSVMPSYIPRKFEGITDNVLLRICPFIANDRRIWDWLKESDRTRIRRLLESADVETLKSSAAFDTLATGPLSKVLFDRFDKFPEEVQTNIVVEHPSKELVGRGIEIYEHAWNFRHAEQLGNSIILPLAKYFDSTDVAAVLKAASENGQICFATGTSKILEKLFDETTSFLIDSRPHWEEFVREQIDRADGDISDLYSYPGLQKRLDRNVETT